MPGGATSAWSFRRELQPVGGVSVRVLADVMNREGITDRPLSVEVCEVNGQPHYIVNMMDSSGGTQSVTLNARGGSQ